MAQSLNPEGFGTHRSYSQAARSSEGPSRFLATIGRADGPEVPLVVQFVGISDAQQRAAISTFPGGKRFVLAKDRLPEKLLRQS